MQMTIIKKRAKAEHDIQATVGDLIHQQEKWNQNQTAGFVEEKTSKRNNFVEKVLDKEISPICLNQQI